MFDQIFGNYLVETNRITEDQLMDIMIYESSVHVKLGLIAVTEKLMTQQQAEEVHHLQTIMDKRFGDIAVEKGYLTDDELAELLKKQEDIYMVFLQAIIDQKIMSLDEIEEALGTYQTSMGYTNKDMDALVSGDIDRIVSLFLPSEDGLVKTHCAIAVRTFLRIIDSFAYVAKAYVTDSLPVDNAALQTLTGDFQITAAFAGKSDVLLDMASVFAEEEFETVNLDALDSVGEFINCINGIFASEMCDEGVNLDMQPPEFHETATEISGRQFCVMPIYSNGMEINLIISLNNEITVK